MKLLLIVPLADAALLARLLPHATRHVHHDGHLGRLTGADELAPVVSGHLRRGRPDAAAG